MHLQGTKEFTLATFLPRWVFPALDLPPSAVFVPHSGGERERGRVDGRFYMLQRAAAAAAAPTRIFRPRDIGQQKLKSSVYSCTRERSKTTARLSRVFKSRDAEILWSQNTARQDNRSRTFLVFT